MAQNPEDIRIIIRNQSYEDQELFFDCNSYVLNMKQKIKEVHTAKPDVTKQKIIYQGKILKDNEVLKDVFKQNKNEESTEEGPTKFIVHIVVTPSKTTLKKEKSKTAAKDTEASTSGLRNRRNNNNTTTTNNATSTQQATTTAQSPPTSTQLPTQWFNPQLATSENMTPQELYNLQYQQYLAAYQQYCAYYTGMNQQNLIQSNPSVATPPPNQNAQNRQNNQNRNQNQPPVVAADGGVQAQLDNEAHDWLDYLYMLLRSCFVIVLVVMYSSLQRVLVIGAVAVVLYLYQRGFFNIQRRIPARPQQPIRRQENNQENNNENNNEDNSEDNNNDETSNQQEDNRETTEQETAERPSRLSTLWCFVTTFFTSLLPNPNPGAQQAR